MKKKSLKQYLGEVGTAYDLYDKIVSRQSAKPPIKQRLREIESDFNKLVQRVSIEKEMSIDQAKKLLINTFLKHLSD